MAPGVVITGASAGVGRAVAAAYARRGWRVGLMARGAERLEAAADEVQARGGAPVVLAADVADADAVQHQAETFARRSGPIDVWINGAMVTMFAPLKDMTAAEFRRITEVTYLGQVHGTMAALGHMRARNSGTVVAIGSALAYRSIPLQSAYCGAKFAVRGFVDALRTELIHEGSAIRLSMVHLPAVNTPQFDWARNRLPRLPRPLAPVFQPEAVAETIVTAARDAPRELWVGYPTVKAIAGNVALPAWLDRKMARICYGGQQSMERDRPDRRDNLFAPVDGDHGARGRFSRESAARVGAVTSAHARETVAVLAGIAAAALYLAGRRKL